MWPFKLGSYKGNFQTAQTGFNLKEEQTKDVVPQWPTTSTLYFQLHNADTEEEDGEEEQQQQQKKDGEEKEAYMSKTLFLFM